ncbi:MAG: TLC domain-containing protein [Nevskiales bacterium]
MILAATATLFFLLLHALVAHQIPGQEFHVQLKLSRGLASIILTALGFYALTQWWWLWPQAFLQRHAPDSGPYMVIAFVSGHFIADVGLLAWGGLLRNSSPRRDLIAHHALGLAACAVVFYYEFGHALFAVALTGEMMPVTSGIAALAPLLARPLLERLATQLRLAVLVLWRLPFWVLVITLLLLRMVQGEPDSLMLLAQRIALTSMAVVVTLDVYWVRQCLRSLHDTPAQG